MNIKEVLKLKEGTQVKMVDAPGDDIWIVNRETLMLKNRNFAIEDRYTLDFIVNAEFEKYYEERNYKKLTIKEVLCEDMVGHMVKMIGDDTQVYKVTECNGRFDLDITGSPMRISDEHFLSTILDSMYIVLI